MDTTPKLNTGYFDSLINDFGIWQHTDGRLPLLEHGYSLDDAARGFVACLVLGKREQAESLFNYMIASRKGSDFFGFATDKREFIKFPASDDAKAQTIWAFGCAVAHNFRVADAQYEVSQLRPSINSMDTLRGPVYALLGAAYLDAVWAQQLAAKIAAKFDGLGDDWLWPESPMTYALGIIPYALLRYEIVTGDSAHHDLALRILAFVERVSATGRPLGPVGNDGWYSKGQAVAPNYSQQPIDAAYMVWAYVAAFQTTDNTSYLERVDAWMAWFDGQNIADKRMFDPCDNKAFDGINATGVNTDSGAETNICFLLSRWSVATRQTF